jgi:hypothetical protein
VLIICVVAGTKYGGVGFPSCVVSDARPGPLEYCLPARALHAFRCLGACLFVLLMLFARLMPYAARGVCGPDGTKGGFTLRRSLASKLVYAQGSNMRVIIFLR